MAKFTATFKDPDYGLCDDRGNITRDKKAVALAEKFFEWDEYVTVELDTETQTARVVPVSETQS
jgi:hypothetical protein